MKPTLAARILGPFARGVRQYLNGDVQKRLERNAMLVGHLHAIRVRELGDLASIREAEFGVFSQWGEDGILQYILSRVVHPNPVFVEFGVENYSECNTRFLLTHDGWRGMVIDSDERNIAAIQRDEVSWRYELHSVRAFVTAENINDLIASKGIHGDIGLLSIDIDGNDYWVWQAIRVIEPRVVVCEYNSVFGNDSPISIPYEPGFQRTRAHLSNLYFGASLCALNELAERKGYAFVGSNSAGSNAFFVRRNVLGGLRPSATSEGYVYSRARDSRDGTGRLTFLSGAERIECIAHMPVVNTKTNEILKLGDAVRR